MKHLFYILLAALVLVSCENEPETKEFKIKDTDMISIKPAQSAYSAPLKAKATKAHLSALEVVKQTSRIQLKLKYSGDTGERSFISEQRDTISEPPKLLMWATDVITLDGQLQTDFIEASDVLFLIYESIYASVPSDTIAYIPNSVLRTAETAIRAAYEAQDIDECYRLFNDAYTFTPITGEEWRALQ